MAPRVAVLGAGLAGCASALALAHRGFSVTLVDKRPYPMNGASRHNEGKLHLGYIYAADPTAASHRIVSRGSFQFFEIIGRLTGIPTAEFPISRPFVYVVPADSALSQEQILSHFGEVDDHLAAIGAEVGGPRHLERSHPMPESFVRAHYSPSVQLAAQTPEIAVDPHQVADVVGAATLAHPLIEFLPHWRVVSAGRCRSGFEIDGDVNGRSERLGADAVINALWESRVHIDATIGLDSGLPWLWRWKATIIVEGDLGRSIPATTAVLGPYGDVVGYASHRTYLSWYPACNLGLSTESGPDPLAEEVKRMDADDVLQKALTGLASLVPALNDLPDLARHASVGGGYIMALGHSDIDDIKSGLHERHAIGPAFHDGWVSLETGKLCTAPMFGVQAAAGLADWLS